MKKKILTLLFSLVSMFSWAESYSGTCGENGDNITWTYSSDDGTLTLSGSGAMKNYTSNDFGLSGNIDHKWHYLGTERIIIGDGITSIGNYAFYSFRNLTSITIPNSVTSIGNSAFNGCKGLTSITIPNSVTSIGSSAFIGCTGLTSITIPNSVTSIGSSAFIGCTGLTSITIPNSVTSIGNSAFNGCTGLTSITIPNSVTSIGSSAFNGCTGLTSITIPNSVTSIGGSAFDGCTGLTSIVIPNSMTTIEDKTFYRCTGLTSITIPNSVTSIGGSAFSGCEKLNHVDVGSNVREIGAKAFYNCKSLNEFICNAEKVPVAAGDCFEGSDYLNGTLYVKKELLNSYSSFSPWYGWGTIKAIEDENPDAEKCETPVIVYSDNKLSFYCNTEGVLYHYSITPAGANDEMTTARDVDLTNLVVSVYATADGKAKSETASKQIQCVREQVVEKEIEKIVEVPIYIYNDTPLSIDIAEGQSISLRITDGILHINNAPINSTVFVYDINGETLMNQRVLDEDVTIKLPRSATYIIKVGEKTFKVKI